MSERPHPRPSASDEEIERAIVELAVARGAGKTICPSEAARRLGGDHPDGWGPLMPAVRRAAVKLMKERRITILRKGRPVDPNDFKGIYRIAIEDAHGDGNSASIRPDSR